MKDRDRSPGGDAERPMSGGRRAPSPSDGTAVREIRIVNRLGLHARASAQFVRLAEQFRSEITVEVGGQRVNAKSIMGLLMLAACQGTTVTLSATGDDGQAAVEALAGLVDRRFGEPE